jgi:1-acyl-sn-glycerol-3-phosphate acyltransferase
VRVAVTRVTSRIGRGAWGLAAWLIFIVVTLPVLVLLALAPGQDRRRRLLQSGARLIFRLGGIPLRIEGLAHLPAGPCIVVANHASYLDGVILTAALPARFAFVIKREMTRVPLAHFMLRRVGSEFVEREHNSQGTRDTRRILQKADIGQSLVFFPEGTFQAVPGLCHFRLGAFIAALRSNLPVVPLVIRGSRAMLGGDRWLPQPGALEVHIHPPVLPIQGERAADLAARCRAIMLTDLGEPDLDRAEPAPWRNITPSA